MSIPEIVHLEVMRHLSLFGCVKGMDPFALHMLKKSSDPLLEGTRNWMRATALRQLQEGNFRQGKISEQLAQEPVNKASTLWRSAVIDPYLKGDMEHRHKASWNDKDFVGFVKREEPKMFAKYG
jgi:hypothetical protein